MLHVSGTGGDAKRSLDQGANRGCAKAKAELLVSAITPVVSTSLDPDSYRYQEIHHQCSKANQTNQTPDKKVESLGRRI